MLFGSINLTPDQHKFTTPLLNCNWSFIDADNEDAELFASLYFIWIDPGNAEI